MISVCYRPAEPEMIIPRNNENDSLGFVDTAPGLPSYSFMSGAVVTNVWYQ
jgi:hypothetical protein